MTDFWTEAANAQVAEPPKASFEALPDKANVILKTTTSADKETVQPKLREVNIKNGPNAGGVFYTLKVPMQVVGGDSKVLPKHISKGYMFVEFNIEKPTAEQLEDRIMKAASQSFDSTVNRLNGQLKSLDKFPCAPELYNFLLDALVPDGESTQARWQTAAAMLKTKADAAGLTIEACKGNGQYLIAAALHAILMDHAVTVIGATYTPKQRPGSDYAPTQTVGSFGAFTEGECKRRKVKVIEAEVKEDF